MNSPPPPPPPPPRRDHTRGRARPAHRLLDVGLPVGLARCSRYRFQRRSRSCRGVLVPTLAAIFPPTQPPERLIAVATAILAATSTVTVGIGLLPVPLRNVALTAMELATLARLFPGRLTAGVGHGVLDWMSQVGAKAASPMTLLREYTAALYAL